MFRLIVDRSTTGANPGDGVETGWTEGHGGEKVDDPDEEPHLAKVRVAGSNPVFRSQKRSRGVRWQSSRAERTTQLPLTQSLTKVAHGLEGVLGAEVLTRELSHEIRLEGIEFLAIE